MSAPSFDEVVDFLGEMAPLDLAAEWDNVGVLLRPRQEVPPVARCLLTIDLTENVVEEAVAFGADLVVSYHPPVFRGLTRLDATDGSQRRVIQALAAGMPVYSPHTALDAAPGGLADWLLEGALGDAVPEEVHTCGGDDGEFGRFAVLGKRIAWRDLIERLKKHFAVKHLQVARPAGAPAKLGSVAVAAGSGGGVLRGVPADVWVTGEMSHHDVLAAVAAGTSVVLAGHSNTERGFLKVLQKRLLGEFSKAIEVRVAKGDRDPLSVV